MKDIVYLEDIVKELSSDFNIPEAEAMELCKKSLINVYSKMQNPEVISISLYGLGVLHFNVKKARGGVTNKKNYGMFKDIIKAQIKLVEKIGANHKNLVHLRRSFTTRFKKLLFKDYSERRKAKKRDVYLLIESKQNKNA